MPSSDTPRHAPPSRPIAAVVHADDGGVDTLLADFAADLRQAGWRVRGLVQPPREPGREKQMVLVDLDTRVRYDISQPLGPGACGCSLDPAGVAAASAVLRRALAEGADLVLANRFGTLEAGGNGLAAEMLALMIEPVPLLTVVNRRYLAAWRAFTGGMGVELPPRPEALRAWFADLARPRSAACA